MAVVLGTNAGFVETSPTENPAGITTVIDTYDLAIKDTAPVGAVKITEIGWWCDNATEETNFEVGLYSHDVGNDKPNVRLYVDNTNAKGTGSGWKTVAVDWEVTAETVYWIAVQVDNTTTVTNIDYSATADRVSTHSSSIGLPNPWDAGSNEATWVRAVYARLGEGVTYSELSGTIVGGGAATGDLEIILGLSGIIVGVGTLSGSLEAVIFDISRGGYLMEITHKKNTPYYLAIPIVNSNTPADFKSGETVADTAYSKDGSGNWTALSIIDTFTEIGSTGIYALNLTAAEMNHDQVIIKMTSSNGADSLVIFSMDQVGAAAGDNIINK